MNKSDRRVLDLLHELELSALGLYLRQTLGTTMKPDKGYSANVNFLLSECIATNTISSEKRDRCWGKLKSKPYAFNYLWGPGFNFGPLE